MKIFSFFVDLILISRFAHSLQVTTAIPDEFATRPQQQKCPLFDIKSITLFEDSSPCRTTCERANFKCNICKHRTGRKREICMVVHRRRFARKCISCIKNPHNLKPSEIKRITSLNDLRYNDEFDGKAVSTVRGVKFSVHDTNGSYIRDKREVSSVGRILFGWKAKPKQIPWQIHFIIDITDGQECGGTLVTPNKIVSAAHCFHEKWLPYQWNSESLVARAGNIERLGNGQSDMQERNCSDIIRHS